MVAQACNLPGGRGWRIRSSKSHSIGSQPELGQGRAGKDCPSQVYTAGGLIDRSTLQEALIALLDFTDLGVSVAKPKGHLVMKGSAGTRSAALAAVLHVIDISH